MLKKNNHFFGEKVLIVAEIGNNHEGDFNVALELIRSASEAGADAVKFQTFIPEYISGGDSERLKRLKKFQLSKEQFEKLSSFAQDQKIIFFSTPFDLDSAIFLNQIQPLFKIASSDNDYLQLIKTVAYFGKPMIVSSGMADLPHLDQVCQHINSIWSKNSMNPGLAILHCVTSYPTPPEQVNLCAITTLKKRFPDNIIGYSDHTLGIQAAVSSVVLGAMIVEKHFTLDKNYSNFRDHQLSADPKDLKEMVKNIRLIETMMGTGEKILQKNEMELVSSLRRSYAASRNLENGTILSLSDLILVRPGIGIKQGQEERIIGKTLKRCIAFAELVKTKDLID